MFINKTDIEKNAINGLNAGFTMEFFRFFDILSIFSISLKLKINVSIVLLRNIFSNENLYNRIRIIIIRFDCYIIKTKILIRKFIDVIRIISKIKLNSGENDFFYIIYRKRYFIRFSFTIIINKN